MTETACAGIGVHIGSRVGLLGWKQSLQVVAEVGVLSSRFSESFWMFLVSSSSFYKVLCYMTCLLKFTDISLNRASVDPLSHLIKEPAVLWLASHGTLAKFSKEFLLLFFIKTISLILIKTNLRIYNRPVTVLNI